MALNNVDNFQAEQRVYCKIHGKFRYNDTEIKADLADLK